MSCSKKLKILAVAACFYLPAESQAQLADTLVGTEEVVVGEEYSDEATDDEEQEDSSRKYERVFMDQQKLGVLRRQKAFRYRDMDSIPVKPEEPAPEPRSFEGIDASILLWLLLAVAIVVVALQLGGVNMRQLVVTRGKGGQRDEYGNEIHETGYDDAIRKAIAAADFALATRLMYLQSLKLLSDNGHIAWHENKTNWQYVSEIKNDTLRNNFRRLTLIFEYVEYGHMEVSADSFRIVDEEFNRFKSQLT